MTPELANALQCHARAVSGRLRRSAKADHARHLTLRIAMLTNQPRKLLGRTQIDEDTVLAVRLGIGKHALHGR